MDILLAGGAGYIGSALYQTLLENGHRPIIVDSLRYGKSREFDSGKLYTGDIGNRMLIEQVLQENNKISMCIHCADVAAPAMSVSEPYAYYHANVVKSMEFFKILSDLDINRVIFCSSAAVYDKVAGLVVTEHSPCKPANPFGRAKHMTEIILRDFCVAYDMKAIVLRNFNPIGIGPNIRYSFSPTNQRTVLRNLLKVVSGELPYFQIFGDDWDTRDGTCIRDYIHVLDMAAAHLKAVNKFDELFDKGFDSDTKNLVTMNIGSGQGVTVKEFLSAFENITGEKIPVKVAARRAGDTNGSYANIKLAGELLDWKPMLPIEEAIIDMINYEENQRI